MVIALQRIHCRVCRWFYHWRIDSMKKRIHVNMHHIRYNKKHGTNKPVITVKTSKSNDYGHEVDVLGPSKIIYSPDKPLSCGARVWIETEAEVKIA